MEETKKFKGKRCYTDDQEYVYGENISITYEYQEIEIDGFLEHDIGRRSATIIIDGIMVKPETVEYSIGCKPFKKMKL